MEKMTRSGCPLNADYIIGYYGGDYMADPIANLFGSYARMWYEDEDGKVILRLYYRRDAQCVWSIWRGYMQMALSIRSLQCAIRRNW